MIKNIFSYKQKGGITAEKISLNEKYINTHNKHDTKEGIWTKIGVIVAVITMLLSALAFIINNRV